MIIDTHCHLDDKSYDDDILQVIARARENGVLGVVIPGADISYLPKAVKISHLNKNVYFAVGVHPYDKDGFDESILREFAKDDKCVAVGECGLDYFRLPKDESEKFIEKQEQKRVFIAQLDLSVELQKPVILHIRDANEDSFSILKDYAPHLKAGAVLHCYNASPLLLELANLGNFYFGIGGVLTFKNAKNLVEILPKIPRDKILIETDAPYLTPEPFRGKRNEPSFTKFVAKKIAEILSLSLDEIEDLTSSNAKRLFKCFVDLSA
ncbi:TatD family hydrolase [Campylobacter sp. faydin G-24]|uniref:TatD family hydrolase n=1 Tax=Campylobacter anatolicus TaxID=2829105 RepID=A0ABS5HFQ5_9BACT|nr:TatD family hydrolase [Campylobacter anatolicus]MBR8465658.1 TatD family hydrolase [Campylobacter anatolicus]